MPFTNWDEFEKKLLKNPKLVEELKRIEPEYQLARSLIGARIKKRMTQAALAKKAHTDQASISRLESGNSKPSLTLLRKVAVALDASLMIKFEI
jgi:DNA-binding XRE family transcriptional regulator